VRQVHSADLIGGGLGCRAPLRGIRPRDTEGLELRHLSLTGSCRLQPVPPCFCLPRLNFKFTTSFKFDLHAARPLVEVARGLVLPLYLSRKWQSSTRKKPFASHYAYHGVAPGTNDA